MAKKNDILEACSHDFEGAKKSTIMVTTRKFGKELKESAEYYEPKDLESAIEHDGEELVFSLYKNERKTQYLDKLRQAFEKRIGEKLLALVNSGQINLSDLQGDQDQDKE
jgi:hypothetical protein